MLGTLPVLLLWTWFIPPSTLSIFGQKNGQVVGGVQSSSNFSASVAITFKSSQCVLGCTESNVSQKKQTSLSQVPWWPEQQGYLQVHRISHWLSWCDSGIRGWLTVAAAHKVVLAALSPQRRTLTHFLRGWVAPVIKKVKVLCYRLTCYYCQIWFAETEKLLPKWYLKSSSCCPFFLAKNTQCAVDKFTTLPTTRTLLMPTVALWPRSSKSFEMYF